jgi:hypothetical protein
MLRSFFPLTSQMFFIIGAVFIMNYCLAAIFLSEILNKLFEYMEEKDLKIKN